MAASAIGRRSAQAATPSSSAAYARRFAAGVRRREPAAHAPIARPPIKAASTVLTAADVCPMRSVSSRVQTTSYTSAAAPDAA